jgi:hypothetical protein
MFEDMPFLEEGATVFNVYKYIAIIKLVAVIITIIWLILIRLGGEK